MSKTSQKAPTKTHRKLETAKRSYHKLMEEIRPFLPKKRTPKPVPLSEWQSSDSCSNPAVRDCSR